MIKKHLFFVAIYLRLSREDEDVDGSIRSYVGEQEDIEAGRLIQKTFPAFHVRFIPAGNEPGGCLRRGF